MDTDLKKMPENYWKEKLTPEQYEIVRQKGT
jgi:peptide-methionine (R)-S-oxide reductase